MKGTDLIKFYQKNILYKILLHISVMPRNLNKYFLLKFK